jgi:hypothetical protein
MDCESVLDLDGLQLRCQLGEHIGLHGVSGERLSVNERGEPCTITYEIFWEERCAQPDGEAVDTEEVFTEMLDRLAAA